MRNVAGIRPRSRNGGSGCGSSQLSGGFLSRRGDILFRPVFTWRRYVDRAADLGLREIYPSGFAA